MTKTARLIEEEKKRATSPDKKETIKFSESALKSIRKSIKDILKSGERSDRKSESIFNLLLDHFKKTGCKFFKSPSSSGRGFKHFLFFNQEKRVYLIDKDNIEELKMLLHKFNINGSINKIVEFLYYEFIGYIEETGQEIETHRASYYNKKTNTIYLHNFRNKVFKITENGYTKEDNGIDNVFFIDFSHHYQEIIINEDDAPDQNLLENLIFNRFNFVKDDEQGLTPGDQRFFIEKWFYSLFFESIMNDKPILFAYGVKGSGKTSGVVNIGLLWWGDKFAATATPDNKRDIISLLANNYFLILDNADDASREIQDTLAVVSTGQSTNLRKLHTTKDEEKIKPRCYIAVTSRTPRLLKRDDLADRTLVIKVERLQDNESTANHRSKILESRGKLWATIIENLKNLLKNIAKNSEKTSKIGFRLADFAIFCVDSEPAPFRENTFNLFKKMKETQNDLALEGDHFLGAITSYLQPGETKTLTTGEWFKLLNDYCLEHGIDFYKNTRSFGWALNKNQEIYLTRLSVFNVSKGVNNAKNLTVKL